MGSENHQLKIKNARNKLNDKQDKGTSVKEMQSEGWDTGMLFIRTEMEQLRLSLP